MKQVHLFENSGVRRLFALLAVLTAVYLLTAFFLNQISVSRFESVLINRESAVAGKLIARHPEQSDEIIGAFVTAGNIKDSERGAAAFDRAGYSGQTVPVVFPSIRGELGRITALYTVPALTALIVFGILTFFALSAIYRRVEQAGKKALSVSHGNYGLRLEEGAEGTFARMNYAFNEMSSGVNVGFEKLRQERVFLKNLISDISHQLKTPLATLKMYNEILLQEPLSGAARDFAVKSGEQLERMEWLILGLLKMARMEAGCLEMNLQNANAAVIARRSTEDFSQAAKEKNIDLAVEGHGDCEILCDPKWLQEAIGNMIKNCLEYTSPGGKVTVGTEQTPVMVTIRVSDTGTGIHPDDLPYVFRRFYRGRASSGPGSGIGLSLAKSIVEQMGGTLTAGGEYGRGAVFTLSFLKDVM